LGNNPLKKEGGQKRFVMVSEFSKKRAWEGNWQLVGIVKKTGVVIYPHKKEMNLERRRY